MTRKRMEELVQAINELSYPELSSLDQMLGDRMRKWRQHEVLNYSTGQIVKVANREGDIVDGKIRKLNQLTLVIDANGETLRVHPEEVRVA